MSKGIILEFCFSPFVQIMLHGLGKWLSALMFKIVIISSHINVTGFLNKRVL